MAYLIEMEADTALAPLHSAACAYRIALDPYNQRANQCTNQCPNQWDHWIITIEEVRSATYRAWALGNEGFLQQIEDLSQKHALPKPRGGNKRSQKTKERKIYRV